MARFSTEGIDDLIDQVIRLGKAGEEVGDDMLLAGAEEVKQAWQESAQKHDLVETGDMKNSIGYPSKPKTVSGMRMIDIYPQGKDRKGVRNIEKAAIQHYGSSSISATHWVDDAETIAGPKVQNAMEQVFDEFLKGKG